MKPLLFFFFLVFLISFSQAITLSLSPPQLDFTEQNQCQKVLIKVEGNQNLTGKTLWAEEGYSERILNKHNLNPLDLNLEVNFPENVVVENQKEIQICISGKNSGDYHGALLYRIENKPLQVGIWLSVSIKSGNSFGRITGNIVETGKEFGTFKTFGISTFILLGILLTLLLISEKKRKTEF